MSTKTFDGKKPYVFLKSVIAYALRPKLTYEDYEYHLSKKKLNNEMLIKYYDLIKPTRCLVEEKQRYLKIQQEDETVCVAYLTINSIVGELGFPSSEIFYSQQQ